jgi:hypothetical protein
MISAIINENEKNRNSPHSNGPQFGVRPPGASSAGWPKRPGRLARRGMAWARPTWSPLPWALRGGAAGTASPVA